MLSLFVIDNKTEKVIGRCQDVQGLFSDSLIKNIKIWQFSYDCDFWRNTKDDEYEIKSFAFGIPDIYGKCIGKYNFYCKEPVKFKKNSSSFEIETKGWLEKTFKNSMLRIWEVKAKNLIKYKNQWRNLNENQKKEWLGVARASKYNTKYFEENEKKKEIELDCTYVNDAASFYCAAGEAVNGPGGYFGSDRKSLEDCINKKTGITFPVKIKLKNFDKLITNLNGLEKDRTEVLEILRFLIEKGAVLIIK